MKIKEDSIRERETTTPIKENFKITVLNKPKSWFPFSGIVFLFATLFLMSTKFTKANDNVISADNLYQRYAYGNRNIPQRIKYFENVIQSFQTTNDSLIFILANYMLGTEYQYLQSEKIAQKYYDNATNLKSNLKGDHTSFFIPLMQGFMHSKLKKLEKSTQYFELALKKMVEDTVGNCLSKSKITEYFWSTQYVLATTYQEAGILKKAEESNV